jgi:hypothetical protein
VGSWKKVCFTGGKRQVEVRRFFFAGRKREKRGLEFRGREIGGFEQEGTEETERIGIKKRFFYRREQRKRRGRNWRPGGIEDRRKKMGVH